MTTPPNLLLLGGTGRTGRRALQQLLARGLRVRALVRPGSKLPPEVAHGPALEVVEADLLSLGEEALQEHLRGCEAIVSCLGHVLSFRGVFGPPRDLVEQAVARVCRGVEALRPPAPIKLVLMSSVSVNRPSGLDARRGPYERAVLRALSVLVPPVKDNQRAADFLLERIDPANAFVQWAVVRPDTLLEGGVTEYAVHEGLVNDLFAPGSTNMANVAHFMCELVTDAKAWTSWKGKLPVVVNVPAPGASR